MGLEAVKWAIRRLNQQNYIPGVNLGLIAYPTCLSEELAGYRAVEISTAVKEKSENIIGIIGAERSSDSESISTILARLPRSIAPPMISYSSTSVSLSDKLRFPNFFRTIYSDQIQVEVITTLMTELQWNYISIVHENNAYGRHGADALRTELLNHGICIRTVNGFNTTYGVQISVLSQIIEDITLPKDGAVSGIVFFGGQTSAEKFLTAMKDLNLGGDTPSIIFSEGVGTSKDVFKAQTIAASRGNLVVSPKYQPVQSFLEHWKAIFKNKTLLLHEIKTNPWLKDVFFDIKGCSYEDVSCIVPTEQEMDDFMSKNIYIKFAVDAVSMFAKALKISKNEVCRNDSCSSIHVDGIENFSKAVRDIQINSTAEFESIFPIEQRLLFDEYGNIQPAKNAEVFSVYNHRKCLEDESQYCFVRVANFSNNKIAINQALLKDYDQSGNERSYHKAQCKPGDVCTICLRDDEQIYYKAGDLIIVAAFAIHNVGAKPLQCGGLRSNVGLDVALTVEHAVDKINENKTIFDGTSIGFIILDSCNNPLVIQERVLRLFRADGYPRLPSDISDRILGFVGSLGSTPTLAMVSITKELQGKPQVGCCSTSTEFNNKDLYPNFVRVSTSLEHTADAMVQLAKQLNALYIQVIYSSGFYGEDGKDAIISSAKKYGICVANTIEVPEKSNYFTVLDELRVKPSAKVVLTFLRSHVGPFVMKAITDNMQSGGEFHFIGSETVGTRKQYLIPRLKGTLSVAQEMPQSPSYLQFLQTKSPKPTDDNSWLLNAIQSRQGCFYPWSFNKSKTLSRECGPNDHLTKNDSALLDPWTPYLYNAVLALLKGSANALREICVTTSKICTDYSDTKRVLQHIKNVHLDLNQKGLPVPVFDENGNGKYGHRIYHIVSDEGELSYKLVGRRTQSSDLVFNQEDEIFPEYSGGTDCPNPTDCKICREFLNKEGQTNDDSSDLSLTQILLIVGISITSFLAILFIVLFLRLWWEKRRDSCEQPSDPYYLTVQYAGERDVETINPEANNQGHNSVNGFTFHE
ncbi:uncharacterized protein LOC133183825 [Saccostrea echinata]|uniref:uncharacterized protein LOC133183825 n=1 Tax=Saccostrea echinata TaxID=191078 RepID=UPI002A7FB1F4|nr:uncharacterized protein LOC133183825 [Saccostrea echinata]